MKLTEKLLFAIPLALSLCAGAAFAENNVSEIGIDVTVRNDGSAYIVQHWHGEFDSGTENYIPIATEDISVSSLAVSDEKGTYTLAESWDVDASFEEKSRKCGINETADGIELCFGISEYGEKSYDIGYEVSGFIKSYTDCDGTNFMFINPNMSTFPTEGRINIVLENGIALNEDNSGIWAFGYDGSIEFQNGAVTARTDLPLTDDASMIVMLRMDKGLIFPETDVDSSFDVIKNKAFEGSDYGFEEDEEAGLLETIIGFIILLAVPLLIVLLVVLFIKRKKAIGEFYKEAEYFRDIPNNGKINVSHYLAQSFDVSDDESLVIGALILSMINKGSLEVQSEKREGFFGREKESVSLKLVKEPDTQEELSLYNLLSVSAGEDDILQEKELEKYSYRNPEKINDFIDGIKKSGEDEFTRVGGFFSGAGNRIKDLSDKGKSELAEIMGLKKYLEEFTLIDEREITETVIWKEYMVYATLFGIAEKVINQFKKVYPEKVPEIESYNRNVIAAAGCRHSMYMSSQRAIQARRTSGGGGRASFGGGGGFSGGGTGGGSR